MLTLTRKNGEALQIGPDITIHFSQIERGRVRVAIDAPADVIIDRIHNKAPGPIVEARRRQQKQRTRAAG